MKKIAKLRITDLLFSIILSVFIFTFAVVFVLNFRPLYYWNMRNLNLSHLTGISEDLISKNYNILIDYNSIFSFQKLIFIGLPMSNSAEIHFAEVKNIFSFVQLLCVFSLIASFILGFIKIKKRQPTFLLITFYISLFAPIVLGVLLLFNWDSFFLAFHKLFFNNDFWIFDPKTDPIISLLPDTFFLQCAVLIIAIIFLLSLTCLVTYFLLKKHWSNSNVFSLKSAPTLDCPSGCKA